MNPNRRRSEMKRRALYVGLALAAGVAVFALAVTLTPGGATPPEAHAAEGRPVESHATGMEPGHVHSPETVTFEVKGMSCGGCVLAVRRALGRVDGVEKAEVTMESGRAVISFDPEKVTVEELAEAIRRVGFEPVRLDTDQPRASL
jgi:copper chaperone